MPVHRRRPTREVLAQVVPVANRYCLLLPREEHGEAPAEVRGLATLGLREDLDLLGSLVDLHREAARGLMGARDGHLAVAAAAQQAVGRVLRQVHEVVDGPPCAETEPLRGDAGDLLRLEEEERRGRQAQARKGRAEKDVMARAVAAVERQDRFLRTVLSLRSGEEASREDVEDALALQEAARGI